MSNDDIVHSVITLTLNTLGLSLWVCDSMAITMYGALAFHFVIGYANYQFREVIDLIRARASVVVIMARYSFIVDLVKLNSRHVNAIMATMYAINPLIIGYLVELSLNNTVVLIARLIIWLLLFFILLTNYIMYYMASSITVHNKVILKNFVPVLLRQTPTK